jgi:hypothetical protein
LLPFALCEVQEDISTVRRNMGKHLSDGPPDNGSHLFPQHKAFRVSSEKWLKLNNTQLQDSIEDGVSWARDFAYLYPDCGRIASVVSSYRYKDDPKALLEGFQAFQYPLYVSERSLVHALELKIPAPSTSPLNTKKMDMDIADEVKLYSIEGPSSIAENPPEYPRDSLEPSADAGARATDELNTTAMPRYSNELVSETQARGSNEAEDARVRTHSFEPFIKSIEEEVLIKREPMDDIPSTSASFPDAYTDAFLLLRVTGCLYRALRASIQEDLVECHRQLHALAYLAEEYSIRRNPNHRDQPAIIATIFSRKHASEVIDSILARSKLKANAFAEDMMPGIFCEDYFSFGVEFECEMLDHSWAKIERNLLEFIDEGE